jgi:hypothetical protein
MSDQGFMVFIKNQGFWKKTPEIDFADLDR